MKPFDLERFKNGATVITRDGQNKAKFVAILSESIPAPLVVRFGDWMENYYMDGRVYDTGLEDSQDLMMNDYMDKNISR